MNDETRKEELTAAGLETVGPNDCVRQSAAGRGAYDLMSPFVAERDAKLFEWGSENRGPRNWELGCPFSRCIQSMERHLVKLKQRDPDEQHDDNLAAIRFWAGALMHYEEMIKRGLLSPDLDDMPRYEVSDLEEAAFMKEQIELEKVLCALRGDTDRRRDTYMDNSDEVYPVLLREDVRGLSDALVEDAGCEERASIARGDRAVRVDDYMAPPNKCQCGRVDSDESDADSVLNSVRLRIYVSGPMTGTKHRSRKDNFLLGRAAAAAVQDKGHAVFSPFNYEKDCSPQEYEDFMGVDFAIIENWANAIYVIASSPGADRELELAESLGLRVFRCLDEISNIERKDSNNE